MVLLKLVFLEEAPGSLHPASQPWPLPQSDLIGLGGTLESKTLTVQVGDSQFSSLENPGEVPQLLL
jgi:hypothetical protein